VTTRPAKRLLAHGWLYIPAVSSPLGGGLIKLGDGSTWAAVAVGTAPYVICALLYALFVIGYLAALIRYLCVKPEEREAMERLITVSANAVVAILTLTAIRLPPATAQGAPCRQRLVSTTADAGIVVPQRADIACAPSEGAQN
jgi:hypothetical protein